MHYLVPQSDALRSLFFIFLNPMYSVVFFIVMYIYQGHLIHFLLSKDRVSTTQ